MDFGTREERCPQAAIIGAFPHRSAGWTCKSKCERGWLLLPYSHPLYPGTLAWPCLALAFTGIGLLPGISFNLSHVLKGLSPNRAENRNVNAWIRREHNSVHGTTWAPTVLSWFPDKSSKYLVVLPISRTIFFPPRFSVLLC